MRPPTRNSIRLRVSPAVVGMVFLCVPSALCAGTVSERAENERVEAMMRSQQAKTRAIAFTLGQSWVNTHGAAGRLRYRTVLWGAWQRGERAFAGAVREGAGQIGLFRAGFNNWRTLGREAVEAVHEPLEKSDLRHVSLDQRFEQASRSRSEVDARLGSALDAVVFINTAGSALAEIERELAKLEPRPGVDAALTLRQRLDASLDGRAVLAAETDLLAARQLRDAHFEAERFNREQSWADSSARDFARLLNARRQALGLGPLRLERRLWQAASTHTEEMKRLGYFAHESPMPDRRTPDRRAELAEFRGSFEGENLFQSRSPRAPDEVLRSWWASDRHRYVLFAGRPNAMGLEPGGGVLWTLMTGRLSEG